MTHEPLDTSTPPRWTALALFSAAYFASGLLGVWLLLVPHGSVMLCFPSGLYLAALVMSDARAWPRWIAAALPAHVATGVLGLEFHPVVASAEFAITTLEAALGAALVRRVCRGPARLQELRDVAAIAMFGAAVTPAIAATVGAFALVAAHRGDYLPLWQQWWSGDAAGVLIAAPLGIVAMQGWRRAQPVSATRVAEALLLAIILVLVAHIVLTGIFPFAYLALPPLLWAALRFGVPGASIASALLAVIVVRHTNAGSGFFAAYTQDPALRSVLVQIFLAVTSLSILVLAVINAQRERALRTLAQSRDELEARVKERTAALRQSEAQLRLFIDHAPLALAMFDRNLRYLAASRRWLADYGLDADIVGRHHYDVFPDTPRRWRAAHRRALAGETVRADEDHFRRGDAVHWVRWEALPWHTPTGHVGGFVLFTEDITERKQAEEALWRSHETFNHLIQNNPFGVYVVDADFRLRVASLGTRQILAGVQPLLGRDFAEVLRCIWPEPFASVAIARFRHTLDTGEPYAEPSTVETRLDTRKLEAYDWRIERITLPDGRYGVVCYFYDLSERQRWEAALRASEERLREADRHKNEFLATLAHELRNPLAPLRTGIAVLERGGGNADVLARTLDMMGRQVNQLVRLIDDLLDVSRISRGKIELRRAPIALAPVIHQALELAAPLLPQRHCEVVLPAEPVYVDGDDARLTQVVSNLVNNACKYTTAGGRIRVELRRERDAAVIAVRDDGIGIPADKLDAVFELFTQLDDGRDSVQVGLGIGLALVRQLVQLHGGTVEASSEGRGLGAEFRVRLPMTAAPAATVPAALSSAPPACRHVLIVDDNRDAADCLCALLEFQGHRAEVAYGGPEALEKVRARPPDVVLLDLGMPDMNGYETCRALRALPPPQPWVVALSGWGQEADRQKTKAAGFDGHLTKPVDPETVVRLLADLPARPRS